MHVAQFDPTSGTIALDDIRLVSAISAYSWVVPGVLLGLPGLLMLIIVALQMAAASVFVPLTRRMLGGRERANRAASS